MATENAMKPMNIDLNRSPICKRARLDLNSNESTSWSLSRNELILDAIHDSGIGRLDSDINIEIDVEEKHEKTAHDTSLDSVFCPSNFTNDSKAAELSLLEASLPEKTLQLLTLNEIDRIQLESSSEHKYINETGINYFDYLSDEVLLYILQKLPRSQLGNVALVCKRFSQLTEDETLWTCMDLSSSLLEKGQLGKIMSRQVIILRLPRSRITYPPIISNVKASNDDFLCRLMYLDLTMASISTKTLIILFEKCRKLRKVSLESIIINDGVLEALSQNKDLEVLNLSMCLGVRISGLQYLLPNCRKITELNLSWNYLSADSIEYVCENLPPTLERFNFSGGRYNLLDKNVQSLVKNCPSLRELDLSDCTVITEKAINAITVLSELNFLALSRCYQVNYRSLLVLKNMKNLANLSIHGTYVGLEQHEIIKCGLFHIKVNKFRFSSIARPTVGNKSTIWDIKIQNK